MWEGMQVIAEPVSKSHDIVRPLIATLMRGRVDTPLKGFMRSEILLTVAIESAHNEKIRLGIMEGAFMRGFMKLNRENPAAEQET